MTLMSAAPRSVLSLVGRPFEWLWATRNRRRATIVVGAVALAGVVGVAAAVGWLLWRLSAGPIPLDTLTHTIEQAVADELGDVRVEISGAELASGQDGGIVVRMADVRIVDRTGQTVIRAPQAVVGTRLVSAALGSVNPTSIELFGPHVSVRRSVDGAIRLGFGQAPGAALAGTGEPSDPAAQSPAAAPADAVGAGPPAFSPVNLFAGAASEQGFLGTLNQLLVRQARLTLYDDASQSIWDSYNATLGISRSGSGIAVYVDAPFSSDSGEWHVNFTAEQDHETSPILLDARFENVVPAEIAARMPALADFSGLMLPVSGRIAATVGSHGDVSAVVGDIRLGAGFIRQLPFSQAQMAPFLVDEGHIVASFNEDSDSLQLEQFTMLVGPNRISLSGAVVPEHDDAGSMVAAQFDLRSQGLRLAADDVSRDAAVIDRALVSGRINFAPLSLELDTINVDLPQGRLTLGATARLNHPRSVELRGSIEDLPVASLVQLWPRGLAPGARSWIASRMPRGRVREARVNVAMDEDDIASAEEGQPLRDDAVSVEFSFDGATARYLDTLPPIEDGSGVAVLSGDRFVLNVERATVLAPGGAPVSITFGRFEVPSLVPDENGIYEGRINVGTSGQTAAMLQILDLEPLGFASEVGVDAARVGGTATIVLDLSLPLENDVTLSQIQIQSGATLSDVVVPDAFQGIALEAPELEIIATHQRIEARGDVSLNGVTTSAVWDARLDQPGGRSNRLVMTAAIDAADLGALGFDVSDFVTGSMPVSIEATGQGSSLDEFIVETDVGGAELRLPALGWTKPPGASALLDFTVERLDTGQIRFRDIVLEGSGIALEGAIRLDTDGSLYKADISRLKLGPANNLTFNGVRGDDGVMRARVTGVGLDVAEMVRRSITGGAPVEPDSRARPAVIDFEFDTVTGEGGAPLSGASGRVQFREGKIAGIRLRGNFESGQPIELDFGVGAGEAQAVVSIDTQDAGAFVRFLGIYARAEGGTMSVRARGPDSRTLVGYVTVRNFNIRDEPLLGRIVESTSGLSARRARNVEFTVLNLEFERQGGALEIRDALIGGNRVGASLRGRVDLAGETMSVTGTYIPNYSVNAAFGAIPLFGPLLSGRSGEGVFGMTYGIAGPMSDLEITINPVSAIAPGLLRRLFEIRQE